MPKKIVNKLAKSISDIGGNVYFVGGYVRDEYLNRDNKDIDIEVYGISPEQLKCICQEFGNVDEIGASFGILKIKGIDIDIAMPRTERKTDIRILVYLLTHICQQEKLLNEEILPSTH